MRIDRGILDCTGCKQETGKDLSVRVFTDLMPSIRSTEQRKFEAQQPQARKGHGYPHQAVHEHTCVSMRSGGRSNSALNALLNDPMHGPG